MDKNDIAREIARKHGFNFDALPRDHQYTTYALQGYFTQEDFLNCVGSQEERIAELEAEVARLRAALAPFAQIATGIDDDDGREPREWFRHDSDVLTVDDFHRARAELRGTKAR
jgi:hypothetical protein